MSQELVTIIIPLHNYEKYIVDCLLSCVHQEYADVEIIVIDDCSTDRSVEMVLKVQDPRIHLIMHKENKGYSTAKNTGLSYAKGEYIVHLDADDCLTQHGIIARLNSMKQNPDAGVVHGNAVIVEGDRSYSWMLRKEHKLKVDNSTKIHAQGVMVRREMYRKYGLYFEGLRSKADKEMWERLRDVAKVRFHKIPDVCAFYRKHTKSMLRMRDRNKAYDNKICSIFKKRMDDLRANGITRHNTRFLP